MSEYIAKASIEPRDYRVVFLIQEKLLSVKITVLLRLVFHYEYTISFSTISSTQARMLFIIPKIQTLKKSKLSCRYADKYGIVRKKSLDFFLCFSIFLDHRNLSVCRSCSSISWG